MLRELGLFSGISVLAGIMIGSGIFYIGAIVLQRSGMSLGLSLLVWAVGAIITLLSGICFAELGAMMPKAGGMYIYVREAFGDRASFVLGFSQILLTLAGSIAALAVAFAAAISSLFPLDPLVQKAIAIGSVIVLTIINIRGVRFGAIVQNIFMVLKMLPILLILFGGLFFGKEHPDLLAMPGGMPSFWEICSMVGFAVVATLWAFEGWSNLNCIAEEIKNPQRNIPLALLFAITGVGVLYVLFNYAIYRTLSYETIAALIDGKNFYLGTEASKVLFGDLGMVIVAVAMMFAIFNSLSGCVMVFPRVSYAMAREGSLFAWFGKLHENFRTPYTSQIAMAVLSIILICSRTLSELTSLVVIVAIGGYALTFLSVIVLRHKYPDLSRPYRVWLYPLPIILAALVEFGLIVNTAFKDPITIVIAVAAIVVGLIVYQIFFARTSREVRQKEALKKLGSGQP